MTKTFTLLLFFIGNIFLSFSQSSFQLVEIKPTIFDNSTAKTNTSSFRFDNKDYLVIQPKNNSESYLSENGVDVQSYLGNGFYLVAIDAANTKTKLQSLELNKIGYISEETKIEESLKAIASAKPVTVLYAPSINENALADLVQQTGISIIHNDVKNNHFTTYVNARQLEQLAKFPFVYFITSYYPKKNRLIYEGALMLGVKQIQETRPYGYNLKGEGVNVGIWDDGTIGTHVDLPPYRNFVVDKQYNTLDYMYHPTEVGGCLGGAGNLFGAIEGIAPRCNMFYWDVANDIVQEIGEGKTKYSVDVSNHSYNFAATNCFQSGLYIPEAADLDKLVYNNPTLLPVVAVGNTASANCALATDTFSSIDIGFQGCKNVLTVGWLFSNEKIVENSGRGPTMDGRIKPELVAKGFGVVGLVPNNGIQGLYGSSYASPQIAGLSALLYQKYKQQFSGVPNASLIKAILLNTARDLGNPGPDYIFGFGKPDAFRAVKSIADNLYFEGNVNQNNFSTHSITVPANVAQLKVTLSWTDKEGNPIAQQAIVNNLDLKLVSPAGDTVLPWKLNPVNPKNNALRGVDNINTNEQVTIDNPTAGTYTIVVKGTSVPVGPQNYAVAYFAQEKKIEITHPNGGEMFDPGTDYIKWYGNGIDSVAKIEFSPDNGATWQTVVERQDLSAQSITWNIPNVVSNQCLIRFTSGNNVDVSASTFSIGSQIYYPSIGHVACDRTVNITWPAVPGATGYKVYLFADSVLTAVGQTSQLSYTINNLINGKTYMYSISTINNGFEGNHSYSNFFTPSSTVCSTLNDVGVYAINKPVGGRRFTSTALTTTEKLSFIIKNFGTATQNSITVSYTINGGPVRTTTLSDVITSNDTSIVRFNVSEDLYAIGNYNVVAWTSLAGDNNVQNDTLYYTIRQLANAAITLPFSESFETLNTQLSYSTYGVPGLDYMDYYPEDGGRLRTNEGNVYANTGNRAITLDNYIGSSAKKNELIFTYNLSRYMADSLVYLDFSYMNRGELDSNDIVYARGKELLPWIKIYDLYANRGDKGVYKNVKEYNLYQKLKVENGQSLSYSTQIRIVQSGTGTATTPTSNGGYSFDDFKLYNVGRDVAVTGINVKKVNCSKSFTSQPVSIKIKNNTIFPITNLPVSYKVGNNPVVTELIPTTIAANDSITYSFTSLLTNSTPGRYAITAWADNPGDIYKLNDTVNASMIIMATIDSFPYYNDFETNNGNLLTEGQNDSWTWGTPLKYNINNAAQENKAWTTGITNGYNFNENSYLYMGCMDFSSLTSDPLISFDFISDIQTQSDSAFAEYSTDGINWNRLGCSNCGLNWYNGSQNHPFWDGVIFPWQVAHLQVPLASLADQSNFMYRIHLLTDNFIIQEGLGIDDIHIIKDYQDIATTDSVYVSQVSTGNGWIPFYRNGKLVAEINDDNKNLGNIIFGYEANENKHKVFDNKNIFPRNWVVRPQNSIIGNYKVRLYLLNSEYTNYVLNEDSISRMGDIGLLRYIGLNTNLDIIDNHVRAYYKYYTPADIQFYPYQDGYYVEFNTDTLGEFYLISTKQDADAIQNINLLDFSAQKLDDNVYLQWETTREVNSKEFIIQYSFDAATFIDVDTVPAGGFSNRLTLYNYLHQLHATSGVYYYRIKMVDNTNQYTYSLIDSVYFAPNVGVKENPVAAKAYMTDNDIVIEFKNKLQTPSTIYVYNTLGQLQFTKKTTLVNGINPLGIPDFLSWSNGAYFLQIQTSEHSYYSKLMKQKQ